MLRSRFSQRTALLLDRTGSDYRLNGARNWTYASAGLLNCAIDLIAVLDAAVSRSRLVLFAIVPIVSPAMVPALAFSSRSSSVTVLPINSQPDTSAWAKRLTLVAMSLGFGVVQLDVKIVNTALSSIGSSIGGGVSELQWVVSAYTIAFAALIMTAGALGDRLGAKQVFMWASPSFRQRRSHVLWPRRR